MLGCGLLKVQSPSVTKVVTTEQNGKQQAVSQKMKVVGFVLEKVDPHTSVFLYCVE